MERGFYSDKKMKIERNDPCSCNSGKKYKKCCMLLEVVEPIVPPEQYVIPINPQVDAECDKALEYLDNDKLPSARRILNRLEKSNPEHHTVHLLKGYYLINENRFEEAILAFQKAVQINPLFSEAHHHLAILYSETFMPSKAIENWKSIIKIEGKYSENGINAKKNLKDLEVQLRRTSNLSLEEHLEQNKLFDRAFACLEARDFKESLELSNQILIKEPKHIQSYINLGLVHAFLGEKKQSIEHLDVALSIDPSCKIAETTRKNIMKLGDGEELADEMREIFYSEVKLEAECMPDRRAKQDRKTALDLLKSMPANLKE